MSELARKLGIKPGHSICLINAPVGALSLLQQECPVNATFTEALSQGPYDIILFWPLVSTGLDGQFAGLQQLIVADGAIWAIMPKKQFAAKRGIAFTWEQMQQAGLQTDLVDNKIAAFFEEDYATRFVIRKARRR